jgi:hypothetical protein
MTRDWKRRARTVLMPFCVLEVVRWLSSNVLAAEGCEFLNFGRDRDRDNLSRVSFATRGLQGHMHDPTELTIEGAKE